MIPPFQDGVGPLEIWVNPLCCLQTGANFLRGHLCPASRVRSEQLLEINSQGTVHVLVMLQLVAEGGALVNQPEILLRHPLGSRCMIVWWVERL